MMSTSPRRWAWLPGELVLAAVVIGGIVAGSYPYLHEPPPPTRADQLRSRLATIRSAIELYTTEHGGQLPGPDLQGFATDLTTYTDINGNAGTRDDMIHAFRRYIVEIPPCPVGPYVGTPAAAKVAISTRDPLRPEDIAAGWLYNPRTGDFIANATTPDAYGRRYCEY